MPTARTLKAGKGPPCAGPATDSHSCRGSRGMGRRFVWFVLGVIGLIVVIVWVLQRV
jgi:hypothetical protein